ncbi:hypothetical protein [Streptomyces sp. NPDC002276]
MTEPKTRKATSAERHAARIHGEPEPTQIDVEERSAAELHIARLGERRESAKPADVDTASWYAWRVQGGDDGPDAA